MAISEDFSAVVPVRPPRDTLNTANLFDLSFDDTSTSPIDQFVLNTTPLNRYWSSDPTAVSPEMGNILLLGYVSAVESFMRSAIRRIIVLDIYSSQNCEKYQLSFGAARHHRPEVLPEALLEETNFLGKSDIVGALRKFVGIELKNDSILKMLEQYEEVCHLRHCCVHRFGKLGVKNAIALGLEQHKSYLEKPIRLTADSITTVADLLTSLVKALNNEIFKLVMVRTATADNFNGTRGLGWTWNKAKDRRLFADYYSIFCSVSDGHQSPEVGEIYERFRNVYRVVGRRLANSTVRRP